MPIAFSMSSVQTTVDYYEIGLGDAGVHLLPTHSEATTCFSNGRVNVLDFRRCRKFVGKARIMPDPGQ